jgi:hypothetical protein
VTKTGFLFFFCFFFGVIFSSGLDMNHLEAVIGHLHNEYEYRIGSVICEQVDVGYECFKILFTEPQKRHRIVAKHRELLFLLAVKLDRIEIVKCLVIEYKWKCPPQMLWVAIFNDSITVVQFMLQHCQIEESYDVMWQFSHMSNSTRVIDYLSYTYPCEILEHMGRV